MKKNGLLILALVTVFTATFAQMEPGVPKGRVDTRGLEEYIRIAEQLQKNKKVPEREWKSLFATPLFYLAINKAKFTTASQLKQDITLAYTPGKTLTEADQKTVAYHLKYKAKLPQLKAYANRIKDGHYRKALQKFLYPFIPVRLQHDSLIPPVVITWYPTLEANGLEDMILQDALGTYYADSIATGVLTAHEAVHSLFTAALKRRIKIQLAETDIRYSAMLLLSGVAQEGLADLIDKDILNVPGTPLYDLQQGFMQAQNATFRSTVIGLDSVLQAVAAGKEPGNASAVRAAIMQYAGHIPGREMAKTIQKAGLLRQVIDEAENPFPFFYAYNQAVAKLKSDYPVLSPTAIAVLKGLEEQLIKPL